MRLKMFYAKNIQTGKTTGTPVEYILCLLIQDDMHSLLHVVQPKSQYVDGMQPLVLRRSDALESTVASWLRSNAVGLPVGTRRRR
jgi:hypothetical protein